MSDFELDFVEWLRGQRNSEFRIWRSQLAGQNSEFSDPVRKPTVSLGIGDDMAVLETSSGKWLMSSDMLLDGVHFDAKSQPLAKIGRKAVACCLSDCAAMAVRPVAITVSLAIPKSQSLDRTKELMDGMWAMADEFETQIVGGDTTRWDNQLVIDVAIVAQPYEGVEPVLRAGARLGDTLYVTGPLGGSGLAGKENSEFSWPGHLTFTPRVREARTLAEKLGARLHAMIDISDGLSLDLWRICRASGVGATLSQRELEPVVSDAAKKAGKADGRSALDHALSDGEDFELLLAVEEEIVDVSFSVYRIGEITDGDLLLKDVDGRCKPLDPKGYVH
ncbi:MAG: thiamine-phosphate kinase [Planctomycetes bacterium]|nr:thiamine-phosphate kinase [Planctomycetota bacterium]